MKNITEILKALEIDIPKDRQEELGKAVAENYKTIAEFDKRTKRLEEERDGYKEQLTTATETLKGFEGINVNEIQAQLAEAQRKAKEAEDNYNSRLAQRDFDDALTAAMGNYKFTSKAAEKAVMERVKGAGLKAVNGNILGLADLIEQIKADDPGAFPQDKGDEGQTPPAKFTAQRSNSGGKVYTSKAEIMKIRNAKERQAAIEANMDLFT